VVPPAPRAVVIASAIGCLLVVALAGPAVFWDQGCIEQETATFIRQYGLASQNGAWFKSVFDPHANDIGTYQARELSYLIDQVDAVMHPTLARLFGAGFSIPLSALVSSALIVGVYLFGLRHNARHCGTAIGLLLVSCFVTSFVFFSSMGLHYRSSKPVLAAVIVAWVFGLLRLLRLRRAAGDESRGKLVVVALSFLALVGGLVDRQGVFLAGTAAILLLLSWRREPLLRDLCLATWLVVIVLQLYNFWLGPLLVFRANGYWPDFSYQRIPLRELGMIHQHLLKAMALILANLLIMLGGNWITVAVMLSLFAAWLWSRRAALPMRGWVAALGGLPRLIGLVLASQIVLFAVMIARHGYVYRWYDHRYWYYPLPLCALALCGWLLVCDRVAERWHGRARLVMTIALTGIVTSNVLSLNLRRDLMAGGPWFGPVYQQCTLLKESLRSGSPAAGLDGPYVPLFSYLEETRLR
jgi:hypothetical protein